jgi:Cd2+/Zn2+-exporting ATPase
VADVGIAMGGLGSDATIETADVVIRTDHPSKIARARRNARATHNVVGRATMWVAVFADVGVALLAILNAVRIQHMEL